VAAIKAAVQSGHEPGGRALLDLLPERPKIGSLPSHDVEGIVEPLLPVREPGPQSTDHFSDLRRDLV
jgi:hypothetical protein